MLTDSGLINFCRNAVKIKSLSGQEKEIAAFFKQTMIDYGYDDVIVDRFGNVIGILHGSKPGKTILLDGHMDHVDVLDEELWDFDPYGAEIHDGKIYGRGATDMKGGLTAMITAVARHAALTKHDFYGKICVSCTVHEECFEGVAASEVTRLVKPDFVIVGEPTSNTVKIGQRGRAELVLETYGVSCHSSSPDKGINAVYHMAELIRCFKQAEFHSHPILGKSIMELTDILSNPYPGASVVPFYCRATYDCRTLVEDNEATVLSMAEKIINKAKETVHGLNAKCSISQDRGVCWTGEVIETKRFFPAWLVSLDNPFVCDSIEGLKIGNIPFDISHFHFCTNASHFCGEAGIPTIGYGPSLEILAHVRNEYIEISDLLQACKGYELMLQQLTSHA